MKQIVVEEHNGFTLYDVSLISQPNNKTITSKKNMNFSHAADYILHLQLVHNLPESTLITDNIYDDNNRLTASNNHTLKEFLEI